MELSFNIEHITVLLKGHTVRDVLMRDLPIIDDNATMKDVASRLLNSGNKNFLVLREGNPLGTVTRQEIIRALRTHGDKAPISNAVDQRLEYLTLGMPLDEAWNKMQHDRRTMMLVVDEGQLKGAVDEDSIEELILLHTAQSQN